MSRYQNRSTKSTGLRLPRFEPTFLPANKSGSTPRLWSPRIICRSLASTTAGSLWCGSIQSSKPKARSRTLPLELSCYDRGANPEYGFSQTCRECHSHPHISRAQSGRVRKWYNISPAFGTSNTPSASRFAKSFGSIVDGLR
jgi:hypothetical protein